MILQRLTFNVSTRLSRDQAIPLFLETCRKQSVYVLDTHVFSNVSLVANFESKLSHLLPFFESLKLLEFRSDAACDACQAILKKHPVEIEVSGTIQVTFATEDGDLRNLTPMIPG